MTEPEEIDLTEEEIKLGVGEEIKTGPLTPVWYESDEHYRPFCEDVEIDAADDADAYASETDPEDAPETS